MFSKKFNPLFAFRVSMGTYGPFENMLESAVPPRNRLCNQSKLRAGCKLLPLSNGSCRCNRSKLLHLVYSGEYF